MNKIFKVSAKISAVIASLLFFSTAQATQLEREGHKVFESDVVASKSVALAKAHDVLNNIKSKQGFVLQKVLGRQYDAIRGSVLIKNTKVSVDEFSTISGVLSYQANVEIKYSYRVQNTNR